MAKIKIELNHREMHDLLTGAEVEAPLVEIAQKIAARARSTAPVDTGAYRDGIRVETDETDRSAARVVAHHWNSAIIESRTGNLKRALGR